MITLGELITKLEEYPGDTFAKHGFGKADSYSEFYKDLAFRPRDNTTIKEMLFEAKLALGMTYRVRDGCEYTMSEYTLVWLAGLVDVGVPITKSMIETMVLPYAAEPWRPIVLEELPRDKSDFLVTDSICTYILCWLDEDSWDDGDVLWSDGEVLASFNVWAPINMPRKEKK